MKITGETKNDVKFTIEPFVTGGFLLSVRYARDGRGIVTGAGVWPSIEKAKAVAEEKAAKLAHGAAVDWYEEASG